ncbi:MAG TPA: G1 family glutamic endopeptidase [Stellaceae bacterium]|nr:G1 family glutamic endopeptidase [Stellaceae bacterium]
MKRKFRDGTPVLACAAIAFAAFLVTSASAGIAEEIDVRSRPAAFDLKHGPINPRRNPDGSLKRGLQNQIVDGAWSGYAVANFQTGQYYTSAVATWQVPAVTYGYTTDASGWEYSSTWVGIGGFCEAQNPQGTNCTLVDGTLIQLGTSSEVTANGEAYYWAWYEMLPAGSYAITAGNSNPVNAGDIMTASLQCTSSCAPGAMQTWTLSMADQTAVWTWTETFQYPSSLLSAEWILEAPGYGAPLDDYIQQTLDPVSANGANPSLSAATNGIVMEDQWGQTSNPSSPALGHWFSTCYGTGTTLTACIPGAFSPAGGKSGGSTGTGGGGGKKKK